MIHIKTVSLSIEPGHVRGNYERMAQEIQNAKEEHVDILVFPELSLSGYFIGDLWETPAFLRECEEYGEKLISLSQDLILIFGNIAMDWNRKNRDGRVRKYNAAFVAQKGRLIRNEAGAPYVIKTLLPTYRCFDDERYFTSLLDGAIEKKASPEDLIAPYLLSVNGNTLRMGVLLCEDSWDEHDFFSPTAVLAEKDTQVLLNLSASPFSLGKREKRHRLFTSHGEKSHIPTLYLNRAGVENTGKTIYFYDGSTASYDENGTLVYESSSFDESPTHWILSPSSPTPLPMDKKPCPPDTTILTPLRYGLSQFLSSLSIDHVTIGISGGIDSAVNAALYRSILPKENILLVNTPTEYNSKLTKHLAADLAHRLGAYYTQIPIGDFVKETIRTLDALSLEGETGSLSLPLTPLMKENIQARDRSSRILSALSSAFGGIFTCNANKTELSIGYGTLYGDLAGAVAATGDLWKHQIYQLGRELNDYFQNPVIPEGIFTIKPSAELSDAQDITKNQGDPLVYDYHDSLFKAWTESWERVTPEEILRWYRENTLESHIHTPLSVKKIFPSPAAFISDLERWWNLYAGFAVAKRIQAPPIVALSRRPYGTDLRESQLTPYYTARYKELKALCLKK